MAPTSPVHTWGWGCYLGRVGAQNVPAEMEDHGVDTSSSSASNFLAMLFLSKRSISLFF